MKNTYRTLTAVDSVIIVIDGAKGVETQTLKLMNICRMRKTPVIVFVNKLDRESKDPFDLLDEIEKQLLIKIHPLTFPINMGSHFKGVYNLFDRKLNLFYSKNKQILDFETVEFSDLSSPELEKYIGVDAEKLRNDVELLDGVYIDFDIAEYIFRVRETINR